MKTIIGIVAGLAVLAGLGFGGYALLLPRGYYLSGASAVQITQVYSQASFYALMSIAAFLFAMLIFLSMTGDETRDAMAENTELLNQIRLLLSQEKSQPPQLTRKLPNRQKDDK